MKGFIVSAFVVTLCWLGSISGLTDLDCPHCWPLGTVGSKPFNCTTTKGKCPCRRGHTNFRCSGCLPGFHPNGWVCCKNTEYHVNYKTCKECGCNPSGTLKCVEEICMCKDGYNGETCYEQGGQIVEFGNIGPNGFRRVIIKCNGRCVLSYLTFAFRGDIKVLGSDKKIIKKNDGYVTQGTMFCKLDKNSNPKKCPAFSLNSKTINLRLYSTYGSTNVTMWHKFDNLKSLKVRYREPTDVIEA